MRTILISLIIGIFLLSLVSANLGTFPQNSVINIRTNEEGIDGTLGSLNYPNGSTIFLNAQFSKNGNVFYYNLNSSFTNQVGRYTYDYCIIDELDSTPPRNETSCFVNEFYVEATGSNFLKFDFSNTINIIIVIASILVAIFLFFFGIRTISGVIILILSVLYTANVTGGLSIIGLIGILGGCALMIGGNKE